MTPPDLSEQAVADCRALRQRLLAAGRDLIHFLIVTRERDLAAYVLREIDELEAANERGVRERAPRSALLFLAVTRCMTMAGTA